VLRRFVLERVDLSGCIAQSIKSHGAYFSEVSFLALEECEMTVAGFDTIINSLPNLQVLHIGLDCRESEDGSGVIDGTRRILTELRVWPGISDELYAYIIDFLPARRVRFIEDTRNIFIRHTQKDFMEVGQEWASRYLTKNEETVQECLVIDPEEKIYWKVDLVSLRRGKPFLTPCISIEV